MLLLAWVADLQQNEPGSGNRAAPSQSDMSCSRAGVKDLLAGEQQAAVTVALEGLLDSRGAGAADAQDFATYDPKVPTPCPLLAAACSCLWLLAAAWSCLRLPRMLHVQPSVHVP